MEICTQKNAFIFNAQDMRSTFNEEGFPHSSLGSGGALAYAFV
jgi:hypothetical protein